MRYQENATAQRLHEEWFTLCLSTSTNRQLLTQRCRTSFQATYSARSSLHYNWLLIY
ncbi:hypothetical protein [Nostoc sp. UHCC 0251]|uniref:hypothetical protein n=1 Tax=Nostoc sp. UHCC 0251 TaxID=3110240 RepID=UPI002B1F1631|nr:hypothetical protein [Nostoc sp. UHCC 0251]MEA5627177.1 hypothetical protein [Nostoc sp. UHCC 0251]